MTDPFWSISLGRWLGPPVRVHFLLIAFGLWQLATGALIGGGPGLTATAGWLGLLVLALALHELGHAWMAQKLELEPDDVQVWPLGNLVRPPIGGGRALDRLVVAAAGPLVSLALAMAFATVVALIGYRPVWNPLDNDAGGAPLLGGQTAAPFTMAWWLGWFGYLNWVLFLVNLIPALPLDGGRALRAFLALPRVGAGRDSLVEPWTARTCAAILILVALVRLIASSIFGPTPGTAAPAPIAGAVALVLLAALIEWFTRTESRMVEDDGFFEDGVFGYDFSEGYTSLEAAPKVRPKHESALRRWRRKRSEVRRARKEAREVAEEQRLDEVLDKLHREGKGSLTEDEERFLLRISRKKRNRKGPGGP